MKGVAKGQHSQLIFVPESLLLTCPSAQVVDSLVYSKLVALNSPVFDFTSCNFTEKNMSKPDKVRAHGAYVVHGARGACVHALQVHSVSAGWQTWR